MALNYINPIDFKTKIDEFITFIENKSDYTLSSNDQPVEENIKALGKNVFDISIINDHKYKIDLNYINQILQSKLSQQEKAHYKLFKFILEKANEEYISSNQIIDIFTKNCEHIKKLLKMTDKFGKTKKLVLFVPINSTRKSNFWFTLFFKKFLEEKNIVFDYMIDNLERVSSLQIHNEFTNHEKEHYLVVICDDISYSGQQLTDNIIYNKVTSPTYLSSQVNLFLNLLGYSDNAKKRIEDGGKMRSANTLFFGEGSKYPLIKISAKFNENQVNNILYLKVIEDTVSENNEDKNSGTLALVGLLLNDVFCVKNILNTICFRSQICNLIKYYETISKEIKDRNGSLQYLPFKYPDSLSTIDNMCRLSRLQNEVIFRVDRLINYINYDDLNLSEVDKLYIFAKKLIDSNKIIDKCINVPAQECQLYFDNNILDLFNFSLQPANQLFQLDQNNQIDPKLLNMIHDSTLITKFDEKINNKTYNNMLFYKFINLNNKISKFNKKHLLEFIGPLSNYTKTITTKYTIKDCNLMPNQKTNLKSFNFCNLSCIESSFYKKINWV